MIKTLKEAVEVAEERANRYNPFLGGKGPLVWYVYKENDYYAFCTGDTIKRHRDILWIYNTRDKMRDY